MELLSIKFVPIESLSIKMHFKKFLYFKDQFNIYFKKIDEYCLSYVVEGSF